MSRHMKNEAQTPVNLKVFLASCGQPPDQMAGFCRWATRRKLGKLTLLDWKERLADFQKRPA